jgi:hypothetical protein
MSFSKLLLIALILWMPLASFANAAGMASPAKCAASCGEDSVPDEAVNSQTDECDVLSMSSIVPLTTPGRSHPRERNVRSLFASHIVEPLLPPPNPASPR